MLYEAYPEAAKVQDNKRNLPLHYALQSNTSDDASSNLIMMLFNAFPKAAKVQDEYGQLPLHVALFINASSNIIKMLFEAYPPALWDEGYNITLAHAKMIREAYPEYTNRLFNKTNEDLPIHIVAKNHPPPNVVKVFLETSPDDAKVSNKYGNKPLHIALKYSAADEVITMLFEAYRNSVKVQNSSNSLPLHLACQYGASADVVKLLYIKYEEAKGKKDSNQVRNSYIGLLIPVE
jgi:ankyrin repeat protein